LPKPDGAISWRFRQFLAKRDIITVRALPNLTQIDPKNAPTLPPESRGAGDRRSRCALFGWCVQQHQRVASLWLPRIRCPFSPELAVGEKEILAAVGTQAGFQRLEETSKFLESRREGRQSQISGQTPAGISGGGRVPSHQRADAPESSETLPKSSLNAPPDAREARRRRRGRVGQPEAVCVIFRGRALPVGNGTRAAARRV
jgi:hypothetical protein